MLMQGDPWGAREAFETSLAVARERKERFEVALTLNALIELDRLEGVEPPQEIVDESRAAIAQSQDPRAARGSQHRLNRGAETKSGREGRFSMLQVPNASVADDRRILRVDDRRRYPHARRRRIGGVRVSGRAIAPSGGTVTQSSSELHAGSPEGIDQTPPAD